MAQSKDLQLFKQLIKEGEKCDLDLSELLKKITEYLNSKIEGKIKIVLLGAFSDGKTTAVAGLLGKVEDNMKIDEDESSDELTIYHVEALGNKYEIVDTPGLFGTKEKEIDGKNVRFSEITEKYISEAHIVIYVCNSVNTLKDSHKEIIKKVLREYKKLDSTIFVINKMDDVADTNDDTEYAQMSAIKRATFIDRLKQVIGLTPEEERNINIACIAANPKNKGLAEWMKKIEDYKRRSHIAQLENCVKTVIEKNDILSLRQNADLAVIDDVMKNLTASIAVKVKELQEMIDTCKSELADLKTDLVILKEQIVKNRGIMTDKFNELQRALIYAIENIGSFQDMGKFLETEIGIADKQLDFSILKRSVNQTMQECAETNNVVLDEKVVKFERVLNNQNKLFEHAIKKGLNGLKGVNGNMVLKGRDLLFKGYKFKPWGAINLAKKIGGFAAILGALFDVWNMYKKWKNAKKLEEFKQDLKDAIHSIFKDVFAQFDKDDIYYQNFAPSYLELKEAVKRRYDEIQSFQNNVSSLNEYRLRIQNWYGDDIEDAEFEEIEE